MSDRYRQSEKQRVPCRATRADKICADDCLAVTGRHRMQSAKQRSDQQAQQSHTPGEVRDMEQLSQAIAFRRNRYSTFAREQRPRADGYGALREIELAFRFVERSGEFVSGVSFELVRNGHAKNVA